MFLLVLKYFQNQKEKNIKCQRGDDTFHLFDKSCNPQETIVELVDNDTLKWPVAFLYPEYGQTDFIKEFHESQRYLLRWIVKIFSGSDWSISARFQDHLNVMFQESSPWDTENKYNPKSIRVSLPYSEIQSIIEWFNLFVNTRFTMKTATKAV